MLLFVLARSRWRWVLAVERQDIAAKIARNALELALSQLVEKLGVCGVCERIFAVAGRPTSIEVGVAERDLSRRDAQERGPIPHRRVPEAAHEHLLRFGSRRFERERLQRADLRHDAIDDGDEACEPSRFRVVAAVVALEIASAVAEDERALLHGRHQRLDLFSLVAPGCFSESRNDLA